VVAAVRTGAYFGVQ